MNKIESAEVLKLIEYGFKVQVQDDGPMVPVVIWTEKACMSDAGHTVWFKCKNLSFSIEEGYASEVIAKFEKFKTAVESIWLNMRITDCPNRNFYGDNP